MAGKPLIAYTITAWNNSKYRTRPAIVSTDSNEIGLIAREYRAEVITRPPYLSHGDLPGPHILLQHVIDSLAKYEGIRAGVIVFLQPTSPLRTAADIDACIELYKSGQGDSVTSVCGGEENGAVYVTNSSLIARGSIYGPRLLKYEMPTERSVDINTQEDFDKAERILKGEGIDSCGNGRVTFRGHDVSKKDDIVGEGKWSGAGKKPAIQRRG